LGTGSCGGIHIRSHGWFSIKARPPVRLNLCAADTIRFSVNDFESIGDRLLVIFDGHCGLCNHAVRWFLVRDKSDHLRFVASESPIAASLLARNGIRISGSTTNPDTILVVRHAGRSTECVLTRSNGVLAMLSELPRPWSAFAKFLGWIPRPVRDFGYVVIARIRYGVWGRFENCPLPAPSERTRFL